MSRSATVRFLAQHILRKHGHDMRPLYLAAIAFQPAPRSPRQLHECMEPLVHLPVG